MSKMGVYRNSENEYVCEYCNTTPFLNLQDAIEHVNNEHKVNDPAEIDLKPELVPVPMTVPTEINEYHNDLMTGGTMAAAERLMMSLIEDYTISRSNDLRAGNKISPMTLNLGKVAAEAMNNYNKLKTINKSVTVNVDGKKSDIDALKEMFNKDGVKDDDSDE